MKPLPFVNVSEKPDAWLQEAMISKQEVEGAALPFPTLSF